MNGAGFVHLELIMRIDLRNIAFSCKALPTDLIEPFTREAARCNIFAHEMMLRFEL